MSGTLLRLLGTPADVLPDAIAYARVMMAFLPLLFPSILTGRRWWRLRCRSPGSAGDLRRQEPAGIWMAHRATYLAGMLLQASYFYGVWRKKPLRRLA